MLFSALKSKEDLNELCEKLLVRYSELMKNISYMASIHLFILLYFFHLEQLLFHKMHSDPLC